jgi:hypothetical protein
VESHQDSKSPIQDVAGGVNSGLVICIWKTHLQAEGSARKRREAEGQVKEIQADHGVE